MCSPCSAGTCTAGLNEGVGQQLEYLVADLLHACDALGMDFERVTEQARVHYDNDIVIY
jgi:hypothetical protein